jgi:hypothetical protein
MNPTYPVLDLKKTAPPSVRQKNNIIPIKVMGVQRQVLDCKVAAR